MTCTHAHTTLTVAQVLCQFLLRARKGRVMSCCGWQAQRGIGTARSPVSLRQEMEVGGAAPGAWSGGWCEKTVEKTPRRGVSCLLREMCISCVDGAYVFPCSVRV